MCYTKTHWRMFAFGGLLKLFGDLATLVGPISITLIFEYIQRNLNVAPSTIASPGSSTIAAAIDNSNNSLAHIAHMRLADDTNESNVLLLSSAVVASPPTSTPMINENTEIYYPTWTDFVSNGWIMALVVLCASLVQGTLSQSSTHIVNMIGIRLRSSLQSLVYRKTLLISSSCFFVNTENANGHTNDEARMHYVTDNNCARNCDSGDSNDINEKTPTNNTTDGSINDCTKDSMAIDAKIAKDMNATYIDTGTIANLMSEDALNVMSFFWIAHYVWAIPLKVRAT